jgi:hypothetical protein
MTLDVLREAARPLCSREIADALIQRKGIESTTMYRIPSDFMENLKAIWQTEPQMLQNIKLSEQTAVFTQARELGELEVLKFVAINANIYLFS